MGKRPELADLSAAVNAAFGIKLRRQRRLHDYSQGELASRVGLSRVTVATIEGGKQNSQLHQVFLFARALDVPVEALVPNLQEVEQQQRSTGSIHQPIAASGTLFLQDARALLLQMKEGLNERQAVNEKTDRGTSSRSAARTQRGPRTGSG